MSSSENELSASFSSESSSTSISEPPEDISDLELSSESVEYPYDEDLEPVATEEEITAYQQQVAAESEEEERLRKRFDEEVDIQSWCKCSRCSVELLVKPYECFCCLEMDRCREKMEEEEMDDECITEHPGFENVCLDKWVLEVAAIGLKTRSGRSYVAIRRENRKAEAEFLRSVAYRQVVRFIWDYMGNSKRTPLPACIYNAIRNKFPSDSGAYRGFEEEDEEENEEDTDNELD